MVDINIDKETQEAKGLEKQNEKLVEENKDEFINLTDDNKEEASEGADELSEEKIKETIAKDKHLALKRRRRAVKQLEKQISILQKTKQQLARETEIRFSGRLSGKDAGAWIRWTEELAKQNKSVYGEVNQAVKERIYGQLEKHLMHSFQFDLFWTFNKGTHAALGPLYGKFRQLFFKESVELKIINMKLDMIINALFLDNPKLANETNEPSAKYLREMKYFIDRREDSEIFNDKLTKKFNKRFAQSQKTYEEFIRTMTDSEFNEALNEINNSSNFAKNTSEYYEEIDNEFKNTKDDSFVILDEDLGDK